MTGPSAALLLLADGRLPAGGHAHSGGVEAAVAARRITDVADLAGYLEGRLVTVGRVDAALAVASRASAASPARMAVLDAEAGARTASPALRAAARVQGRGVLRVGRRAWPSAALEALGTVHADGPMWSVALGAVGAAAGLDAAAVALAAADAAITGPAWAAVRLLGLDPYAVTSRLADLAPAVDREAALALRWNDDTFDPVDLPAAGGPLLELGAEDHATWEVRLFAS